MKKGLLKLLEIVKLNHQKCEWCKKLELSSAAKEFESETQELLQALKNKDIENIKEEIGDVLLDTLYIAVIAEREGLFKAKDIFKVLEQKVKRRKPWLFKKGKPPSSEEAVRIWNEAKAKEKQEKLARQTK